jgi:hypothetical protein
MAVDDWIGSFLARHMGRCPRSDWPREGSGGEITEAFGGFLQAWRHTFVTRGVEERWADLASLDLAGAPPRYLGDHLPAVVKLAIDYRVRDNAGAASGSVEEARLASKGCPRCGGSGLVSARVHAAGAFRTAGGVALPAGSTFGATCPCPMGEAIQRADAALPADKRSRLPRAGELPMACLPLPAEESDAPPNRDDALGWLRSLVAASRERGGTNRRPPPRERQEEALAARESRPDLDAPVDDPILAKERAPTPPVVPVEREIPTLPEEVPGWF